MNATCLNKGPLAFLGSLTLVTLASAFVCCIVLAEGLDVSPLADGWLVFAVDVDGHAYVVVVGVFISRVCWQLQSPNTAHLSAGGGGN
jgi:hypothetical protein